MKTPYHITVTPYLTACPRSGNDKNPHDGPRQRFRWRAEFNTRGGRTPITAEGFENPNDAIGAVIRAAAQECEDADQVLDFVAKLLGDLTVRPADFYVGRAVRIAARHPKRVHPGCTVTITDPIAVLDIETARAQRATLSPAMGKGGVA